MGNNRAATVAYEARLGLGGIPTDRASGGGRANAQDISERVCGVEYIHSQVVAPGDQVLSTGRELHTSDGIIVLAVESGQKVVRVGTLGHGRGRGGR